ncbi:hypothetical protein HDV04_002600 [Boothiomyces sp. JEL0838]|nr:hypothetical protein HDV04_002600 [Boothiomyces sp. JEL0838]
MPGPKKKTGLGRALIRDRFRTNPNSFINDDGLVKNNHETDADYEQKVNMQSITQENDLEAFLTSAELADTDFTAERLNITVVSSTQNNFVLTEKQERETLRLHSENKDALTIPRRPKWDANTTAQQLQKDEKESFLDWRRGLVYLEEEKGLLLTPYERNIEVWRQLWRVIERSELVVQIVDARNPLFFQSEDLQKYVKEVDENKVNLLLVNKADLLTVAQRVAWGKYFKEKGIQYTFFSAMQAREVLEQEKLQEENPNLVIEVESDEQDLLTVPDGAKIIGALDLIDLLQELCPESDHSTKTGKRTIGFVGYPNVGKSSTLNALVGATKVTVSSTPGKTKHFQTIHLSDSIILCDCPGLVFPSFATTKAEMVINGVLPIDQLREHVGPSTLIGQRIPKYYLEAIYGIKINTRNVEGDLINRPPTAEELLSAYAIARGFAKSSQGNPDEARAARYILKDYVNGKLLYVHPPPGINPQQFNREIYEDETLLAKQIKKLNLATIQEKIASSTVEAMHKGNGVISNSKQVDNDFFQTKTVRARTNGNRKIMNNDFARVNFFPHQEQDGTVLPGKKSHKKEKRKKVHAHWTAQD